MVYNIRISPSSHSFESEESTHRSRRMDSSEVGQQNPLRSPKVDILPARSLLEYPLE